VAMWCHISQIMLHCLHLWCGVAHEGQCGSYCWARYSYVCCGVAFRVWRSSKVRRSSEVTGFYCFTTAQGSNVWLAPYEGNEDTVNIFEKELCTMYMELI